MKNALISHPVCVLSNSQGHMAPDRDVCDFQVGCVFHQLQPDMNTEPTGYRSRPLTDSDRKYDTTQGECLAIIRSVLLLRAYLDGTRIVIRSDHDSLKWIFSLPNRRGKLAYWRLRLSKFEFDDVYGARRNQQAANALFRF